MSTSLGQSGGKGWYLAREAGWLAGVPARRIGEWVRHGYIQSSRADGPPRAYSYQDVAEAMVVHTLLDLGAASEEIRRSMQALRVRYGNWALATVPVTTAWFGVVREPAAEGYLGGRAELTSLVAEPSQLDAIAALLRRGGWAIRDHQGIRNIEVNPDRLAGTPTIRGRRVPAETVAILAMTSDGRATLRDHYELDDVEIDDATRWYAAVSELSAV